MTVYVDYQGKEHKDSGYDTEYIGNHGNVITKKHYRQPMSRTEYETKKKTVVDNIEQTSGYVDPKSFTEKVFTANSNCAQQILGWMGHFNNTHLIEVNDDYFKDYTVIPETVSRSSAQASAEKMARNDIGNVASRQVPGDRYEGLSVSSSILDVQRKTVYIGVYHIFYEYEGKNYNCLMCAGDKVEDVVLGEHPIDDSIKARHESLQEEISKNGFFSRRTLFLYGAIILTINCFSVIPGMFFSGVGTDTSYSGLAIVLKILVSILLVAADAFCIHKYVSMKKEQKRAKAEKESFKESNEFLKKKIYELIQDDSIPEEGKKETIEGWINDQFGNLQKSDLEKEETNQEGAEKKKKIMIISGIAAAILIVVAVVFFVITPEIRYKGAIKNIENGELVKGVGTLKTMSNYKDASDYIEKYGTPMSNISDDVWLRGTELLNYFYSDEFEKEFGEAEKEALDKEYGKKLSEVTIKEYASTLASTDIFNKNLKEIEQLQCSEEFDELFVEDVKGFYYLACDRAIAKYIENSDSTYYYKFELQANNSDLDEDLGEVLKLFRDEFKKVGYGTMHSLSIDHIAREGLYSIIGAKIEPDSNIDLDNLKYFGENADGENTSTEDSSDNEEDSSLIDANVFGDDYLSSGEQNESTKTSTPLDSSNVSFFDCSSYLIWGDDNKEYLPEQIYDNLLETAWQEGVDGYGEGEYVSIAFDDNYELNGMTIYNGYQKSEKLYFENGRPQRILMEFSDGTSTTCTLDDIFGSQTITFSQPVNTSYVTITILSVYKGEKYEDTSISEVAFY